MRRIFPVLVAVVLTAASAACTLGLTAPSNYAPFTKTDLTVGTGAAAASGNTLSVNYTGWLYDSSQPDQKGAVFDASAADSPFTFTLGTGQVIDGWEQGLVGMQAGGTRRLIIPPSMAYGQTRHGLIPPNATLVFDIELVSVQ